MDNKAKQYKVEIGGETFVVRVTPMSEDTSAGGETTIESIQKVAPAVDTVAAEKPKVSKDTAGAVTAPNVGMVVSLKVKVGDDINSGDVVAVTEAMKVQTQVHSAHTGSVEQIVVKEGDVLDVGDVLMIVK